MLRQLKRARRFLAGRSLHGGVASRREGAAHAIKRNIMKKVFGSNESPEVEMVRNLLEKEGIECSIKTAAGLSPISDCFPELWVMDDADYPKAVELIENMEHPQGEAKGSWVCPKCGETIEGQFTSCWRCTPQEKEPAEP